MWTSTSRWGFWRRLLPLLALVAVALILLTLNWAPPGVSRDIRSPPDDCVDCSAWDRAGTVETLTGAEVFRQLAHAFSEANKRLSCRRLIRPGGKCLCWSPANTKCSPTGTLDGKKPVCLDAPFFPADRPCLVYSFGVKDDTSFEGEMARFGCEVHAFDPTIGPKPAASLPAGVTVHQIGIDGETRTHRDDAGHEFPLMTLDDLRATLGHRGRRIDFVKLDAEGSEWAALKNQLIVGHTTLLDVPQLAVEFHLMFPHGVLSADPGWHHQAEEKDARRFLRTVRALEAAGYRLADTKSFGHFPGIGVAHVYETLWLRRE